jgi:hypothetical protein
MELLPNRRPHRHSQHRNRTALIRATDSLPIVGEARKDGDEVVVVTLLVTAQGEATIRLLLSNPPTRTLTPPLLHQHSMVPRVAIKASGSKSTGKRPLHMVIMGHMLLHLFLRQITIPTTLSLAMPSSPSTLTILDMVLQLSHNTVLPMVSLRPRRRSGRPRRTLPSKPTAVGDLTIVGAIKVTELPREVGPWDRVCARDIEMKQVRLKLTVAMADSTQSLVRRHPRLHSTRHLLKHTNMPLPLPRLLKQ